jgi:transcriptional regulator with XRE-family HTH domain
MSNEGDAGSEILTKFGSRVRELRQELGLSQEAFAEACDLDRTYIGSVERGERNISLKNIERISTALGITVAELMAKL